MTMSPERILFDFSSRSSSDGLRKQLNLSMNALIVAGTLLAIIAILTYLEKTTCSAWLSV